MKTRILASIVVLALSACAPQSGSDAPTTRLFTHGPVLGRPGAKTMSVWARTSRPASFKVVYGLAPGKLDQTSEAVRTSIDKDLTGVVALEGLKPDTLYHYRLQSPDGKHGHGGTFRTYPESASLVDPKLNPKGLFNVRFEFACGNNQGPKGGLGPSMPTYNTLNKNVAGTVNFAILNGDWLYEEDRDYAPDQWLKQVGATKPPHVVRHAPAITGVWENYKTYLGRAKNLARWHRHVPSFYTFDDHELLNDIYGSGTAGFRHRRAVFRDIGVRGWEHYLGWSNPMATRAQNHFGTAELTAGSDILVDKHADFTALNLKEMANLHVHWDTKNFGVKDIPEGDFEGGDPNGMVYDIIEVLDKHRLKLSHKAKATRKSKYSIGRHSYGTFKIANARFFLLDTRTHRQLHDIKNPGKKGLSMLGTTQRDWLVDWLKKGDADFYFVVSSVNFMVPHVGGGGVDFEPTKDDAWTVFLEEREMLINLWDKMPQPVFVLTGDLHNSFAIKVTDNVWEFASGPHNSVNHRAEDEGNRPVNGPFKYGPRACDIRWSTVGLADIPRSDRKFPHYCVVQINNVFNAPKKMGGQRWVQFPRPHVVFQFYNGLTGELDYAETIQAANKK